MSYQNILTQRVGRAALVTLNRPEKLNALSYELHRELDQELTLIENEQGVDVVILTGAGDRAFSSGGDIPQMASTTAEELAARREFHSKATWHIATFAKPIIGAINGLAYGGGAMLSSMLDIRIGCDRTAFRFLAVRYGRVNSTWTLPLMVGMAKAKELLYTGRVVEAKEAERFGVSHHYHIADLNSHPTSSWPGVYVYHICGKKLFCRFAPCAMRFVMMSCG